ncbi:MAG: hypothetical protein IKX58_07630, partial [Clostridia bacterium]|nr:hypothetical protein [Clostridia bacterium]
GFGVETAVGLGVFVGFGVGDAVGLGVFVGFGVGAAVGSGVSVGGVVGICVGSGVMAEVGSLTAVELGVYIGSAVRIRDDAESGNSMQICLEPLSQAVKAHTESVKAIDRAAQTDLFLIWNPPNFVYAIIANKNTVSNSRIKIYF